MQMTLELRLKGLFRSIQNAMKYAIPLLLALLTVDCADRSLPRRPLADVIREHTPAILEIEQVYGVEGTDARGAPCIVIVVKELTPETERRLPGKIEGYPVSLKVTEDPEPPE
jgi:hypothetical protein